MKLVLTAGIIGISSIVSGLALTSASASAQAPSSGTKAETVTVNPGDSLARIAAPRGTTYQRLFDANPTIANPNVIYAGSTVRVPAAGEQLPSRSVAVAAPAPAAATAAPAQASRPAATRTAASAPAAAPVAGGSTWDRLAQCESGGNWSINTGNGYYGGLQFNLATWRSNGGTGNPADASREQQIAVAERLKASRGFSPWPACSAKLGLR